MTTLTQAQFARHLGVDRAHITRLKQAGRLVLTPAGQVDVEASEARIAATSDPAKAPVAERHAAGRAAAVDGATAAKTAGEQMSDKVTATFQQSRAVRERYGALKAKAEYEAMIGKLVDADAARSAVADLCVNFRQAVEVWPDTIGPLLVQKDLNEIRQIMQEHAEALLLSIRDEIKDILAEKLP